MSYVLSSLVGDFSKVAEEIDKELDEQKQDESSEQINKLIDKMSITELKEKVLNLTKDNVNQAQTILNLRRELNEVYDKHKAIYAELGEVNYFLREAFKVSTRNFYENGK